MGNSLSDSVDLLIPFFGNFTLSGRTLRKPRFLELTIGTASLTDKPTYEDFSNDAPNA
jgi:hypothetical protein